MAKFDDENEKNAAFNFEVLERITNYLLENGLLNEADIPEGETAEDAAQTYINVYERLRKGE